MVKANHDNVKQRWARLGFDYSVCQLCSSKCDISEVSMDIPPGDSWYGLMGNRMPVFPLVCTGCGHVRLFSTLVADEEQQAAEKKRQRELKEKQLEALNGT